MRVPVISNVSVLISNYTLANYSFTDYTWTLKKISTEAHPAFMYIEIVCNIWFTVEIVIRFENHHFYLSLLLRRFLNVIF
jgi:hypothetical protein